MRDFISDQDTEKLQLLRESLGSYLAVVARESRNLMMAMRLCGPLNPAQEEIMGYWSQSLDAIERESRNLGCDQVQEQRQVH